MFGCFSKSHHSYIEIWREPSENHFSWKLNVFVSRLDVFSLAGFPSTKIIFCYCLGTDAWQPLTFSFTGGSSDVIQPQQQRVKFTVSYRTHCRNHTYVLEVFSQKIKDILAVAVPMRNLSSYYIFLFSTFYFSRPTQWWSIESQCAGTFPCCGAGGQRNRCDFSGI